MKHLAFALVLVVVQSVSGFAQVTGPTDSDSGPDVDAVLARNEELNQAFLHADVSRLERLIANECLRITGNGIKTKAQWLARYHHGGPRRLERIRPPQWRRIRIYGDAAIITSASDMDVVMQDGRYPIAQTVTRVWVKRAAEWYLVLVQQSDRRQQRLGTPLTP